MAVAVVRLERELYPLSLAMTKGEWCVLTMMPKVVKGSMRWRDGFVRVESTRVV